MSDVVVGVLCVGFPDYRVTVDGKVWSIKRNKFLKPWVSAGKFEQVGLRKDGKLFHKLTHRLVAEAIIPNPKKKKRVRHKDLNTLNNNINNLEWK